MNIAIIGAGISGLSLAALLRQYISQANITLYERDLAFDSRFQGYELGLKPESGSFVLDKLGLLNQAKRCSRGIPDLHYFDSSGRIITKVALNKRLGTDDFLILSRLQLRKLLLSKIHDVDIHYGKKLVRYQNTDHSVVGFFDDNTSIEADYMFACDGSKSLARKQLHGDKLNDLNLVSVRGVVTADENLPILDRGNVIILSPNMSFFVMKNNVRGEYFWSIYDRTNTTIAWEPEKIKEYAQCCFAKVKPEFSGLVEKTPAEKIQLKKLFDCQRISQYLDNRLILVGDAAHAMSPFQGEGANMAMLDAWQIVCNLQKTPNVRLALEAYQNESYKRSWPKLVLSRDATRYFHYKNPVLRTLRNMLMKLFVK